MILTPTTIANDILKLVDKDGQPLGKIDFIDPESPLVLIDPQIGRKYEAVFWLLNSSEWKVLHVRFHHDYEDVKLEPSYIDSLKPHKSIAILIKWSPFTTQGIEEKIKNHKITVSIQPSCTVEIEQEVKQ